MMLRACIWTWLAAGTLFAQELDTGHFAHHQNRKTTLADRATDEWERRDFTDLQKAGAASERRRLADAFVLRHPQSWLLGAVYQAGAAASIELRDYARALEDGRTSLGYLRENAPMLIAMAQIERAGGRKAQAARDAWDALWWLSVFAGPPGFSQKEWDETRRGLEDRARTVLSWASVKPPAVATPPELYKDEKYAGSEACKACHAAVFEAWSKTGMAAMLKPVKEARLLARFASTSEYRDASGEVRARTGGGDRPYFEFAAPGGGWKRFAVDYAIGSKWQQAYVTRLPDDRMFVFPIQFNALQNEWLNYWAVIDPPGSERADVTRFTELSQATSYQRNCAVCHTSQLRLTRLVDATMERAWFREAGIDCEACHGPSARHAAGMRSGKPAGWEAGTPPFRYARMDPREATMVCGQCHRQSALRDLGANGEMNYRPGWPYFSRLLSQPYWEFGARAFYKDGRFRETTFVGEAFMRSACFLRGKAQCASCHNPHPADAAENQKSLKYRANPDQMCLQCHGGAIKDVARHSGHRAESAGSRCVACHMPPIMNSVGFRAASHQIDDVPSAVLTARFGQEESPNACLVCHKDKDVKWLGASMKALFGER
jgi:predicted CXXCH cytochrome family protein